MNKKTLIQFAHLGKKFAYYILLVAGESYDLNCNTVYSPCCSVHLVRKSSELKRFC